MISNSSYSSLLRQILLNFIILFSIIKVVSQEDLGRPNFLFILVDDLPFDALGFTWKLFILKTPNIDHLAKEATIFSNFFCDPICLFTI